MSIRRRFQDHGCPLLVTTSTSGRRPIFRSETAVRMFLEVVAEVRRDNGLEVFAWVVMPDHVHLVVRAAAQQTLSRAMQLTKGRFANRYNDLVGGRSRIWQERYDARVLASDRALAAAIDYVHQNPVAAGIAKSQEDYPWSSARLFMEPELSGVEALPG